MSGAAASGFAWVKDHRDDVATFAKSIRASLGTLGKIAGAACSGFTDGAGAGQERRLWPR